jgi:hypothetical protein
MTLKKILFIFYSYTLYTMFDHALGGSLYPKDNEIHSFGRHIPALQHHAFSFSYVHVHVHVVSEKIGQF